MLTANAMCVQVKLLKLRVTQKKLVFTCHQIIGRDSCYAGAYGECAIFLGILFAQKFQRRISFLKKNTLKQGNTLLKIVQISSVDK